MLPINQHIASINISVQEALVRLNQLSADAILFVVDEDGILIGSLTDGDLRRVLFTGLDLKHI